MKPQPQQEPIAAKPPRGKRTGKTFQYREFMRRSEIAYFRRLLNRCRWNVRKVANICGLDRTHLYRKLRQLGFLNKRDVRRSAADA